MSESISNVKVWEGEITLPTYVRGPEDKNPPLLIDRKNPIHPGSSIIYPYPFNESLTDNRENRSWKAIFLENEYLRLTFMPELGGKLYSVLDTGAGEEVLYRNHVIKFARIGIRGAWVSGGIEWNFPNGHTVTASSPIDYALRENEDGSASVVLSDVEKVSRMKWSVNVTLYKGRALFETHIRLFNRTPLPNRFWFWSNSAAPASPGLEFITTATKVMTLKDVMDFPIHKGTDLRWDKNHLEPQDLFSLNLSEDFVGWYNHDTGRGLMHCADRWEAQGRKFFTWGNSDDGKIWTELLTDRDGPYSEMQSGRLKTQRVWEIMQPFSCESWKEVWYPFRKIGRPVYANKSAALSIAQSDAKGKYRIGIHVIAPEPNSEISVHLGEKVVWTGKRNLDPINPYTVDVPIPVEKCTGEEIEITIKNRNGQVLARYMKKDRPEPPIRGCYKLEPVPKSKRADDLRLCGTDFERVGDFEKAKEKYEDALRVDPHYSPARLSLGLVHLRRGIFDKAIEEFSAVIESTPSDECARFFLGAAYLITEQFERAIEVFQTISRSGLFGAQGAFLLGGLYLGQGGLDKAVEHLEKSQSLYPENFDAQVFLACALRKKQQRKEAAEIIDAVLKKDPTSFCALAEHYFIATESNDKVALKGARERLRKVLRGEVQSYLEMSIDYARFGLYDEGIKILTLYLDDCPDSQHQFPLLHYYLGYYYEKVGKISDSRNNYRRGGEMAPHFVFPHRLESDIILRRVLEVDPEDKKAMYYLGNLLCSKGRTDEAVKLWEKAANMGTQFSVVHRNLGRAYWRALCQPDMAIREYERAIECDRLDYKLYYELDELYTAYALNEKRHDLMRRIPEELLGNDMIGERMAAYYTDVFDFDRALEILHGIKFYPWEAYTEGRRIYEDACIGKAILHFTKGQANEAIGSLGEAMKYPRNLGVGEPAKKNHAEALFRMGLAYESMDDGKTAKSLYQKAVEEEHTERSALCYYQARALQCLGKKGEASAVLNELFTPGDAGSDEASNLYLRGLACKGTGDGVKALHYFKNALALNPAHRRSHWEVTGFSGKW